MRALCLLFALMAAPACAAAQPKWYALGPEEGCISLSEIHAAWPATEGSWTPPALLNALRAKHRDAELTPLLKAFGKERPRAGKAREPALKYYTRSNAFLLTAGAGRIRISLLDAPLCAKLGALPPEPEQWLAARPPRRDALRASAEVPHASWYEVTAEHAKFAATHDLGKQGFVAVSDGMAAYRTGERYRPEPGKQAYLVRGVKAGKGDAHRLFFKNGVLYVMHPAPRRNAHLRFSPIVVNLPAAPRKVVVLQQTRRARAG